MMNSSGTAAAAISNPSGMPRRHGIDLMLAFQTLHGPNASTGLRFAAARTDSLCWDEAAMDSL